MRSNLVRLVVVLLGLAPVFTGAQTLTRGPYLQMGSTTATTVRWRTSTATGSVVRYGTNAATLNLMAENTTAKTEHEIRLTGLSPDMTYYYSVGNASGTLAGGPDYFFVTAPLLAKPTRIWVLGDSGTGTSVQTSVRDAYYTFTGARHTDLWLMLGDNAYNSGTDAEYTIKMFAIYPAMFRKSVLWTTLGNHDGDSADSLTQSGPYYDIATLPKQAEAGGIASGTEAYYSFNYGNIHFVCLDSYETSRAANGAMATWLKADLANNTRDWLIVFFHHPPYSKGSHDSDTSSILVEMRQNFVPILENYGVDLVLAGHSHAYERTKFIDGHYGISNTFSETTMVKQPGSGQGSGAYTKQAAGPIPHSGAVYAVAGASGQTSGGALNHAAMYISLNVAGSLILDVNGNRLDATYLDGARIVRDSFTMVKGVNGAPTSRITNPLNGTSFVAPANITIDAAASDSNGTLTSVRFYQGSTLIGTDVTSPYSFTWTGVAAGTYTLTAVATDNTNMSTTSVPITITVNNPGNVGPTVSLTSPTNGSTYTAPATVTLNASASDSDGSVIQVDFYQGSTLLGSDTSSPYSFNWNGAVTGAYSLTARATDSSGAVTTSSPVSITVNPAGGGTTLVLRQGVNGYTGMTDTSIRSDATNTNYGNTTTLLTDGSPRYSMLLKWDIPTIPAGKQVTNATVIFNVENPSPHVYEVYALKRSWTESKATWTRAAQNANWQLAGASGSNDRDSIVLGTIAATNTGTNVITLNPAGIAVLQSWINNPATNHGFIVQDYTVTDGVDVTSSEGATSSLRPALTITYQ